MNNCSVLRLKLPLKGLASSTLEYWNEADDRTEATNEIEDLPHPDLLTLLGSFIPVCRSYMDLGSSWDDAKIIDVQFQAEVDIWHIAFTLVADDEIHKRKIPTGRIDGSILDQQQIRLLHDEALLYATNKKRAHHQMSLFEPVTDAINTLGNIVVEATVTKARNRNRQPKCNDDFCEAS